jgi:hypothetical protein
MAALTLTRRRWLPVEKDLKKKIRETLLTQEQFLTHVDLIVGMDDDFLSADFPK